MANAAILNLNEFNFSGHIPTLCRTFHFIVMVELSCMVCQISRILKLIMADGRPFE